MKTYEAIFEPEETKGVFALSLVDDPAMEDLWVAMSKHPQQVEFSAVDEEKRLLLGACLIPNKKIYRNLDGKEFYLTFTDKTIEKLAHYFLKNQYQNNSTFEHRTKIDGMSVAESWIVENPKQDKSIAFGKEYEKGTWVVMMKVDNDAVWQKVKQGEVKGFSIEALIQTQEINFNNNSMSEQVKEKPNFFEDFRNELKTYFTSNKEVEEVKEEKKVLMFSDEELSQIKTVVKESIAELMEEAKPEEKEEEVEMAKVEEPKKEEEVEMAKEPEAKAIKPNPERNQNVKPVELSKAKSIKERVFENLQNTMNY